jgi:hypothetical protein
VKRRRLVRGGLIALAPARRRAFVGRRAFFLPPLYFRMAYYLIQRSSVMRDQVDWPTVRAEADALRAAQRTTTETYPAIRHVLSRLGDHHSHLADPETVRAHRAGATTTLGLTAIWPERIVATVSAGGPAEAAGVRPGDVVEAVNGKEPAHVETVVLFPAPAEAGRNHPAPDRRCHANRQPDPSETPFNHSAHVRALEGGLGSWTYLESSAKAGASTGARSRRSGSWILVRRGAGGWWTSAATSAATCGRCCTRCARFWARRRRATSSRARAARSSRTGMAGARRERSGVSAAEARPAGRRAHEPPHRQLGRGDHDRVSRAARDAELRRGDRQGLPTSNQSFPLVDGAVLVVTVSREADRTGRVYDGRIEPDEKVAIDWTRVGTDDDPVLHAAAAWLRSQPQCAGS